MENSFKNIIDKVNTQMNILRKNTSRQILTCPICNSEHDYFLSFNGRKNATCPTCHSLERDRFLYYFLTKNDFFKEEKRVLNIQNNTILNDVFRKWSLIDFNNFDLKKYNGKYDELNFSTGYYDNSFDVILANHILQYLYDDEKFLYELLRIIKPSSEGAYIIIMIPFFKSNAKTRTTNNNLNNKIIYETPLRQYGKDFKSILESVGLNVEEIEAKNMNYFYNKFSLIDESIFICRK